MSGSDPFLHPGVIVRHPGRRDGAPGQARSMARRKVTVDFQEAGKQVIDTSVAPLTFVSDDPRSVRR